jgi:transcriptional regulator GlxA family with amidase domain
MVMLRRILVALLGTAALGSPTPTIASPALILPKTGKIPVAIVVTENANLIDFAGPLTVFTNVIVKGRGRSKGEDVPDDDQYPFDVFLVGDAVQPLESGSGMKVTPRYDFDHAPAARIVVVGAQRGSPKMKAWLQKAAADPRTDVIMSVCTGAFRLASAGLLDGKPATTHHGYVDELQKAFPRVQVRRGLRFVRSDDHIFTAGGLTSGIDLALHVVDLYFGDRVAQGTADWMEYRSAEWKTPSVAAR